MIRFQEIRRLTEEDELEITRCLDHVTRTVGWYPHNYPGEVRGPFFRWFILQKGDDQGQNCLAPVEDDVKYCAMAMNSIPSLMYEIECLRQEIKRLKASPDLFESPFSPIFKDY